MTCLIVLRLKIILVCNSAVTVASLKKFKKIHINYGFVVFHIDVLVIVVFVVIYVVITVGNHNCNQNLLHCLPFGEFVALQMFGYISSVIVHLLA